MVMLPTLLFLVFVSSAYLSWIYPIVCGRESSLRPLDRKSNSLRIIPLCHQYVCVWCVYALVGTPSLKSYRTATTLCVPDLVFNDIARHKILLPEGTPVQREILTGMLTSVIVRDNDNSNDSFVEGWTKPTWRIRNICWHIVIHQCKHKHRLQTNSYPTHACIEAELGLES